MHKDEAEWAHQCRQCGKRWAWINMERGYGVPGLIRLLMRVPLLGMHYYITCPR